MNKAFKLLIGYDGSDSSNNALRDLKRAGLPRKVKAVVLTIADVILPSTFLMTKRERAQKPLGLAFKNAHTHGAREVREAYACSVRGSRKLKAIFPSWKVSPEVTADSPFWGLVKKAYDWRPDLVVVGARGLSASKRLFLGSVSQKVLTETRCAVRISRSEANGFSPVRLVIAVDGSPEAAAAVQTVSLRSWPKGTAARLVTVVDARIATAFVAPSSSVRVWTKKDDRDPQAWVHRMLDGFKKKLSDSGLIVSSVVKEGDPKQALLQEAERWGADTLFLGSRGLGLTERLFLGSVSSAIAARAHCSVEIVHLKRV